MQKKNVLLAFGFLLVLAVVVYRQMLPKQPEQLPIVAITQIATHPALDEVRNGIVQGLRRRGYEDKKNISIIFRNANGDPSLTIPIAQEFVRLGASVIVPISTPSALSAAKTTNRIPIVFSGVTDPVGTGLVTKLQNPGGNVTGVSDRWPFEAQVTAFQSAFPSSRRIGMLYTRGDDVSKIGVEAMKALSQKLRFELRLLPVSEAADVYPAAVTLLRDVDAIYTGIDHLLLENLDGLVKAAREARKPLFGGESGSVEKGGVLALSINMTSFGDLTAEVVAKILDGQKPGDIPVQVVSTGDLLVNKEAAAEFGLNLDLLRAKGAKFI